MTNIRGMALNYDFASRVVFVDNPTTGAVESYLYDGEGRRVKKISATASGIEEIIYHYELSGNILSEEVSNPNTGNRLREYLYVNGQLVSRIDNDNLTSSSCLFCISVTSGSGGTISVSWNIPPSGATTYEIWRIGPNGTLLKLSPNNGANGYQDTAVTSNSAYVYRIVAKDANGNIIYVSDPDLFTTITFVDDPLNPSNQRTTIKAQHIYDLRTAVNAVRNTAGLETFSWSDTDLLYPQRKSVRALHVQELRSELGEALSKIGIMPSWTNASLNGQQIMAGQFMQLRQAVK